MRLHHLQTQYTLLAKPNYVTMATFSKYFFLFLVYNNNKREVFSFIRQYI